MLSRSGGSRGTLVPTIAIPVALACLLGLAAPASPARAATEEIRVSAGADDAEQTPQGYFSTTSSDLELAYASGQQTVGMRFNGVSVPRGAVVSSAYLQFQVDEASSGAVDLSIRGEATDTAAAYSATADVLSRVPTFASVAWSPPAWPTPGEQALAQRTPDIAAVIQEIVDRPGWEIGQSLAILITGSGTRVAESYNGDPNGAPLLHLEYTLSDQEAPTVDAGPDQQITLPQDAMLDGSVTDDGLPDPPGAVATSWSQLSGPGVVTFADPSALDTTASFSRVGSYVLRLSASDGERTSTDDVQISVDSSLSGPVIGSFAPTSGQVASVVSIAGGDFSDVDDVTFDGVPASFWIESDALIHATVPVGATSGPVAVSNAFGFAESAQDFVVESSPTVLVGAGDISNCGGYADETADLLAGIPGTVFTAGDHAYSDGTVAEFNDCYDPTWGRHRERTRPSPGPVDYDTPGAAGYFGYFGAAAGEPDKGYYSYDVGAWHVVALNSECAEVGGCGAESPQGRWLREDLIRNPSTCTVAYWASPRFSSGDRHGSDTTYTDFWEILYAAGAEVVVNGHDHIYERFAPQRADGTADPLGIREFVVGTGGYSLYTVSSTEPNSEVHDVHSHGVLKLTLNPTSYDWRFIPIPGDSFTDSGSDDCVEVNQVPLVDAGPDLAVTWPGSAQLVGEVVDDGWPTATLTIRWSQIDGPGTATFGDSSAAQTSVWFSQEGEYLLRLSGDDGEHLVTDDVSVVVVGTGTQVQQIDVQIRSGSDDAEERVSDRSMYMDSSDVELVDDFATAGGTQLVGMRFAGIDVPQGATVLGSYVQFQVDEVSVDDASLAISAEASDDSPSFAPTTGNLSARDRTAESIVWQPQPWPTVGAAGTDQRTPDLSAVVQEVLDRSGWSSGAALTILVEGSGRRTAESYDGDPGGAPKLHIRYTLSSNETPIDVPDVVGQTRTSAESSLIAAGLVVGNVTIQASGTVAAGLVLSQDPAGCVACAAPGDPVDLVVSSGSALIDVPNVIGQTRASAESSLVSAGLVVGSVTTQISETVAAGVVMGQDPADCAACAVPGDPVDLVVSSGPAPIDVPDVVGQTQASAESSLVAAGLAVGNVTTQSSATVAAGLVLSQDPAGCVACAAPGDPVDLVISSGPPNAAPIVTITAPADGTTVASGELLTLSGTASDAEDGNLAAGIVWSSSKDGVLGTGPSVAVRLSNGRHTITATVTDSRGASASDEISLHVRNVKGP